MRWNRRIRSIWWVGPASPRDVVENKPVWGPSQRFGPDSFETRSQMRLRYRAGVAFWNSRLHFVAFTAGFHIQRVSSTAAAMPAIWATNPGAFAGAIPANVSDSERASVTAGLAKDVDAVNQ